MVGERLRMLKQPFIFEICGDAVGAQAVIPDAGRLDTGSLGAASNHPQGGESRHGLARQAHARLTGRAAEQRAIGITRNAGRRDVFVEIFLEIVMAGHLVLLAAFLMQRHPAATSLDEIIPHLHLQRGAHAGKGVGHDRDERAITQADELARIYGVKQRSRFVAREHRGLAALHHVFRAAHGMGGIDFDDVAGDQPVEQHAQRGQVLLDRGRGEGSGFWGRSSALMKAAM
jgi:hypothetical protein